MEIYNGIINNIEKYDFCVNEGIATVLFTGLTKFPTLIKLLKMSKGSGAIVLPKPDIKLNNPNDENIKDKFKKEVGFYVKTIFYSSVLSVSINQILGMIFDENQNVLNIEHVFSIIDIFITTVLLDIGIKTINHFKKEKLTPNQTGTLVSVIIGTVVYLMTDKMNEYLLQYNVQSDPVTSAIMSGFITFLLNTNYMSSLIIKLVKKFTKKK